MKFLTTRKLIGAAALVLLLGLSVSSGALGQGRGHGHGHGNANGNGNGNGRGHGGFSNFDKKCGKFVNCHDARDGRWDGRGPRRHHSYTHNRYWRHYRNHR